MSQAVAYRGRLPGLRVDPALPQRLDDTIRLDVAAFVGLAERGPVDEPHAIEDLAQYDAVFGGDLPLAIDEHGAVVHAALPDAVRSFFDNGGRRVHVVRVVGDEAVTLDVPLRVASRRPLGDGLAIVDLTLDGVPVETFPAATPGGWSRRVTVDIDAVDTVLSLATAEDGTVDLTPASRRLLDAGDAVLMRRDWQVLWVPSADGSVAPEGGWQEGDVARLVRIDLTVRVVDGDVSTALERFEDLRLGSIDALTGSDRTATGPAPRSRAWTDVLQPAVGGFLRERSAYLRAPAATTLVPVVGAVDEPVPSVPTVDGPVECSRAALQLDGLASFDPVELFLDAGLTGHTVEGLRLALEVLGLEDEPRARGLHAIAFAPEVALVAVPDLYHRPWSEQAVPTEEPAPEPLPPVSVPSVGFHPCDVEPADPPVVLSDPIPPAELRMVVDPASSYDAAALHTVVGALADLCAARADMVAVVGLPRHAGMAEAQELGDMIASHRAATTDVPSYVGLWHPWGAVVEPSRSASSASLSTSRSVGPLRPVPPDGAVTGTIAAMELARGWWVEPAGRPLAGFVSADPVDLATMVDLFDHSQNVVRRRPSGFVATSAHSLSTDRAFLQLSVRRLLIYVRKLALREGLRFVFEPDDERFRDQVASTFVRFLERLRIEGALSAYQVEVEALADRAAGDEGRLRIDLKLAPTSPIEFITVSLLRSGDGLVQVAG